jgi:hypothetical protein
MSVRPPSAMCEPGAPQAAGNPPRLLDQGADASRQRGGSEPTTAQLILPFRPRAARGR